MPLYVKASQWADQQGLARHVVYREFHAHGYVTDRNGNRVHAERAPGGHGIHVYPDGPPDRLAGVDADALVTKLISAGNLNGLAAALLDLFDVDVLAAKLRAAGHVVLTPGQAEHLGLADSPIPMQMPEEAR